MMGMRCIDSSEACPVYYASSASSPAITAIMNAATVTTWAVCRLIKAHDAERRRGLRIREGPCEVVALQAQDCDRAKGAPRVWQRSCKGTPHSYDLAFLARAT